MTLAKGDHLLIKRGDKVYATPQDGMMYHEFEVTGEYPTTKNPEPDDPDQRPIQIVGELRVVS